MTGGTTRITNIWFLKTRGKDSAEMNTRAVRTVALFGAVAILLFVPLLMAGQAAPTLYADSGGQRNINGMSYEEWSVLWWQWVEGLNPSPIDEVGDVDCSRGQTGDLWFLAGSSGGAVERTCTNPIPPGTKFVFPLINGVYSEPTLTVDEKRAGLAGLLDGACNLKVSLDGREINSNRIVRAYSPPFLYEGDPEAVADGYWMRLNVPAGEHTLQFSGDLCAEGEPYFGVAATYHLTVENPKAHRK